MTNVRRQSYTDSTNGLDRDLRELRTSFERSANNIIFYSYSTNFNYTGNQLGSYAIYDVIFNSDNQLYPMVNPSAIVITNGQLISYRMRKANNNQAICRLNLFTGSTGSVNISFQTTSTGSLQVVGV